MEDSWSEWSVLELEEGELLRGSVQPRAVDMEESVRSGTTFLSLDTHAGPDAGQISSLSASSAYTSAEEDQVPAQKSLRNSEGGGEEKILSASDGAREKEGAAGEGRRLARSAPGLRLRGKAENPGLARVLVLSDKAKHVREELVKSGETPTPLLNAEEVKELERVLRQLHEDDQRSITLKMSREAFLASGDHRPPSVSMSDDDSFAGHPNGQSASFEVVGAGKQEEEEEEEEEEECILCLDDKSPSLFTTLPCRHRYCNECLMHYFSRESEKAEMTEMRCPDTSCRRELDRDLLKSLGAKKQAAKLKSNERKKQRQLDAMSHSGRNRAMLCGKFLLGTIRNCCFLGVCYPQDDGCAFCYFLCSCGGFCCNCFCDGCCGACSTPSWSDCYCIEDISCLNGTCWGNDVELCPYCVSLVQYTGGCPNIHCKACGKNYVRDQQCNYPCFCCAFGMYVPIQFNVCFGEGECCEVGPNMWCFRF